MHLTTFSIIRPLMKSGWRHLLGGLVAVRVDCPSTRCCLSSIICRDHRRSRDLYFDGRGRRDGCARLRWGSVACSAGRAATSLSHARPQVWRASHAGSQPNSGPLFCHQRTSSPPCRAERRVGFACSKGTLYRGWRPRGKPAYQMGRSITRHSGMHL